jgi:dTDP-4-dehydrorhamnose 3,5-epimerase
VTFTETEVAGAFVIDLETRSDERGFFARTFCRREFEEHGLNPEIAQSNLSLSASAGTLRGMHLQLPPHEEAKLVRCTSGALYDVALDLRPESPSYLRWVGVELTAENRRMLYVPEGCAHGFQTLLPDTEAFYQVSAAYAPEAERGFRWDDVAFGIEWPDAAERTISEKDEQWPDYEPMDVLA